MRVGVEGGYRGLKRGELEEEAGGRCDGRRGINMGVDLKGYRKGFTTMFTNGHGRVQLLFMKYELGVRWLWVY